MVMQEPIIFNYSILENVLYGKINATNSEVQDACNLANCMDFIDNQDLITRDDSVETLIKRMEMNESSVVEMIGK
jgi:ABC-type multidrug transport system fused ATPase/permease subunit